MRRNELPDRLLSLLPQIAPEVEIGQEVGVLVGEARMLLPCGLLLVRGAFARIRDRQRRGEHEHLAHAALGLGLQDHPAEARVDAAAAPAGGRCR